MDVTTTETAPDGSWRAALPWAGTLARLILAGVWLVAGFAKVGDLAESGRAVNAYRLLPYSAAQVIGAALPFVEIALGILLLLGVATRLVASVSTVLLTAFVVGIISAWARGLSIECGCFGGGGELTAGQHPNYGPEIARDAAFLAISAFLIVFPRTRLSIDERLMERV